MKTDFTSARSNDSAADSATDSATSSPAISIGVEAMPPQLGSTMTIAMAAVRWSGDTGRYLLLGTVAPDRCRCSVL